MPAVSNIEKNPAAASGRKNVFFEKGNRCMAPVIPVRAREENCEICIGTKKRSALLRRQTVNSFLPTGLFHPGRDVFVIRGRFSAGGEPVVIYAGFEI